MGTRQSPKGRQQEPSIETIKSKTMAVKDLTFEKQDNGRYSTEYVSSGEYSVVQLERKEAGHVIVHLRLPGMQGYGANPIFYYASKDFMFEVNVPQDVEVKIESFTEVLSCKVLER